MCAFSEASPDQLCGYKLRSLSVLGANTGILLASKSRCDGHSITKLSKDLVLNGS